MARILIADDDAAFREGLRETLAGAGHVAAEAQNAEDALQTLGASSLPDLVFLDLRMPGIGGLDALRGIKAQSRYAELPVVIMTAYSSSENTIDAMRLGAFDHLSKPVGRDDVLMVVERALRAKGAAPPVSASAPDQALIGDSPAMREVRRRIAMAAAGDSAVLVTGETGTGKGLVARVLHEKSPRAGGPCITVDCAAVPAELLEAELFGHARGATPGAAEVPGSFRAADGGSLFLDEIGDLGLAVQARLLAALQEREVLPAGASAPVKVDVRVIAASSLDLVEAVRLGRFREDLYYRLNAVPVHVPPLRERLPDLMPLARHFLGRASNAPKVLTPGAMRLLGAHDWPGNVRELKNLMERLSVLVRGAVIDAGDIQLTVPRSAELKGLLEGDLQTAVAKLERLMISQALQHAAGNRAEAARLLGIRRQLLYVKLKQYGIE